MKPNNSGLDVFDTALATQPAQRPKLAPKKRNIPNPPKPQPKPQMPSDDEILRERRRL